jgi:ABC-type multidrug transport system fused ATPase/permease subunit/8-oxo-dGTP pyrophosphatase MutT (NUDIX family)
MPNLRNEDLPTQSTFINHFSFFELFKTFLFFLQEEKKRYFFWISIVALCYLYFLVPPWILGQIVDFCNDYLGSNKQLSKSYIWILLVSFSLSHIFISFLRLIAKNAISKIGITAGYNATVMGFERLMDHSLRWHTSESSGGKIAKIQNGSKALTSGSNIFYLDILQILTQTTGIIVSYSFQLYNAALCCIVYVFFFYLIQRKFHLLYQFEFNTLGKLKEKSSGIQFEGASQISVIKSLGAADSMQEHITSNEAHVRRQEMKIKDLISRKWRIFQALNGLFYGFMLYILIQNTLSGKLSIGQFIPFFTYFQILVEAAGNFTHFFDLITEAKTNVARMMEIYHIESHGIISGTKNFPKAWSTITLKNVSFRYQHFDTIKNKITSDDNSIKQEVPSGITNVSFTINKGSKIGIAGSSGSGKSTLSKILLGLYIPNSGEIVIDNTEHYFEINHEDLLKHVTVVPQESEVFNFTLRENITLQKEVSASVLLKALQISELEEVVKKLPHGLDTIIGEKGVFLSGGEKQRLAIARALCKQSDILILDEATSALDTLTEKRIQKNLEENLTATTILFIAHRISTLQNCTCIYVFEKGNIVESGTFQELSNNQNSYFHSYLKNLERITLLPLRPNVCILLFNQDYKLFVGERIDSTNVWQLPQGGVETHLSFEENVIKEIEEETGIKSKSLKIIKKLKATHSYEFEVTPPHYENVWRGQTQTFWLVQFSGNDSEIILDKHHPEFQNWLWVAPEKIFEIVEEKRVKGYTAPIQEFVEFVKESKALKK